VVAAAAGALTVGLIAGVSRPASAPAGALPAGTTSTPSGSAPTPPTAASTPSRTRRESEREADDEGTKRTRATVAPAATSASNTVGAAPPNAAPKGGSNGS